MSLDNLCTDELHQLFLNMDYKTLEHSRNSSKKMREVIDNFRHWYSKEPVKSLFVEREGTETNLIEVKDERSRTKVSTLENTDDIRIFIAHINPEWLLFNDNTGLHKMHHKWWLDRKKVHIYATINYDLYLPMFRNVTSLIIESERKVNLKDVIDSMTCITLLKLSCPFGVECEDEELEIIRNKTANLKSLQLDMDNQKSPNNHSILKFIEEGNLCPTRTCLYFSILGTSESELENIKKLR
ncbi:unnamed protein product [Caenorhabditis angaria]|uniref:F-box domain-containing protein n=1 Tax=Caenorhabditis angaria TaxID=860376 RepID=A0A9P1ITU1_9PELO|nr:unnamed protein product [Caenorhabditis angaria]